MIDLLFGPIASGKSTYAAQRAGQGAVIINDDAIVLAIHGGRYDLYDRKLKPIYKGIGLAMLSAAIQTGRDAVIDSTALTYDRRERYRLLAQSFDEELRIVRFREGVFLGAEDGDRRFEAGSRGLSRACWQSVGIEHARLHEPLTVPEKVNMLDIPWNPRRS